MADLLSLPGLISLACNLYPRASKNWITHKVSFLPFFTAVYFALIKKKAIIACYFDY